MFMKGFEMVTVLIMTILCLTAVTVGFCFLEGNALRAILSLVGLVIWASLTFWWWFYPLLEKWIPR